MPAEAPWLFLSLLLPLLLHSDPLRSHLLNDKGCHHLSASEECEFMSPCLPFLGPKLLFWAVVNTAEAACLLYPCLTLQGPIGSVLLTPWPPHWPWLDYHDLNWLLKACWRFSPVWDPRMSGPDWAPTLLCGCSLSLGPWS